MPGALQFEVKALKQQMGFPTAAPPGAPDITRSSLELLRLERDKMNNERVGGTGLHCCPGTNLVVLDRHVLHTLAMMYAAAARRRLRMQSYCAPSSHHCMPAWVPQLAR